MPEHAMDDLSLPMTLTPEQLYTRCDPAALDFYTTADLDDLEAALGQGRALDALRFGVDIAHEGYNLYVMGSHGLGKHTAVGQLLSARAETAPAPSDWCYINNFKVAHKPRSLQLPSGTGVQLQRDMQALIKNLLTALPATFDSDNYRTRIQEINDEFKEREEQAFNRVSDTAREKKIMLLHTPGGYTMAPLRNGEVLRPDEFEALPEDDKKAIEAITDEIRQMLRQALQEVAGLQKEHIRRINQLNEELTRSTVSQLITDLKGRYKHLPAIVAFLDEVGDDIVTNVDIFRKQVEEERPIQDPTGRFTPFNRYYVNVLVDASANHGAPVVYEDNPTYQNLIGRIEHVAQFGNLMTDFTLIKPGALHRANGGYLVLDARKVLTNPFAWEALKRALQARELRIQTLEQMLSLASTISLEPESVPLDVKVVLVGERLLYYLLNHYDPEFALLFKVQADFAEDLDRSDDNTRLYAQLIATLQRREKLLPMNREAVARLIEYSARRANDAEKLSLHMGGLVDLLRESDYWAQHHNHDVVGRADVDCAIDTRIHRASQVRERMQEATLRGIRMIETEGSAVAQVNGLAVVRFGEFAFGFPSRITATARLGEGKVIDIEREVELGGALHSKGVMILSSYLANRFARSEQMSLTASLVFEQSYGMVDGDSASTAELCALQSALADLPLRQDVAITGSVNQYGGVQAIGGVNEKIEGFFDICQKRGLTGTQAVIIPVANVQHLMLREDIVEAVRNRQFAVHGVCHVDEAMAILTGVPAGKLTVSGEFTAGSVNERIRARLAKFGAIRQRQARQRKWEQS